MSYLIFSTETAAWNRADKEGKHRNLPYHRGGGTTRYVTAPQPTAEGKWALNVEGYNLTAFEQGKAVESFEPEPETEEI